MKRALFSLIALNLAFVFACREAENGNGNANANKNLNTNQAITPPPASTDKIVQLFVSDDPARPGSYEVEDPGTVTIHKRKNQRIVWCVVYEGKTSPTEVVIDHFRSLGSDAAIAANPFGDGSDGDNRFNVASADFNTFRRGSKTPKTSADLRSYKYMITVKVNGVDKGHLDPVVIIDN